MKEIPVMTPEQEREAIQQENADIRQAGLNADYGNPADIIRQIMTPILARWTPNVTTGDPKQDAIEWASYLNRNERHIKLAKDAKEFRQALSPCAAPFCLQCDALRDHIQEHGLNEHEIRHKAAPVPGKKDKAKKVHSSLWDEKRARALAGVPMTMDDSRKKLQEMIARIEALPIPNRPQHISRVPVLSRTDPKLVERFGKPRAGQAIIWDEANRPVRVEEEVEE